MDSQTNHQRPTPPGPPRVPAAYDHLAGPHDLARGPVFDARRADWRNGAVVYHVMVDRFAPAHDLDAKRHLYPEPKRLVPWDHQPAPGSYLQDHHIWSHEVEFWGGDLASLRARLDYFDTFHVDCVYLNPIHAAFSNHKYDADDWAAVSPEFGTREDVIALAKDLESRGKRLVLDGVFNHMGRRSPRFQRALHDEHSAERKWFDFSPGHPAGYRSWFNSANLPEVRFENEELRRHVWESRDSVVRSYLRDGVHGWRLDVAYDFGTAVLDSLTKAAHDEKEDALVVGEIWNYPEEWFPSVDGVMNFHVRELMLHFLRDEMPEAGAGGRVMARALERLCADCDYEHLLKSWLILDNHDTGRLATVLPDPKKRAIAQAMQFTLPGSPVVYYGVEAGMTGGNDPEMRGPMDWTSAVPGNAEFDRLKALADLRATYESLRIGDFRVLDTNTVLAYQRRTDRFRDTVTVIVNASDTPAKEVVSIRDSKIIHAPLVCRLTGAEIRPQSGVAAFEIPAWTVWIMTPQDMTEGYSSYKRTR